MREPMLNELSLIRSVCMQRSGEIRDLLFRGQIFARRQVA
jgi:hypothetical protein